MFSFCDWLDLMLYVLGSSPPTFLEIPSVFKFFSRGLFTASLVRIDMRKIFKKVNKIKNFNDFKLSTGNSTKVQQLLSYFILQTLILAFLLLRLFLKGEGTNQCCENMWSPLTLGVQKRRRGSVL